MLYNKIKNANKTKNAYFREKNALAVPFLFVKKGNIATVINSYSPPEIQSSALATFCWWCGNGCSGRCSGTCSGDCSDACVYTCSGSCGDGCSGGF
ncbi:MAG: hypothetical protein LBJ67_13430 [Planctomycetaceae bacterium]|jgi:hypothetical protein|nr:hypothetical protein [Planctomycetaceae bacterium]